MAFRPCVSCGRRFHGGSVFTYLTWYVGEERFRVRMVQCADDAAELRNGALEVGDSWVNDDWESAQLVSGPVAVESVGPHGALVKGKASA